MPGKTKLSKEKSTIQAPIPAKSEANSITAPDAKPKRSKPKASPGRMSALDAAAKILAGAREPMTTGEMVEAMLAKGLWKTDGKTPAATLYSAILREITKKAKESRFRKAERGKFALAK